MGKSEFTHSKTAMIVALSLLLSTVGAVALFPLFREIFLFQCTPLFVITLLVSRYTRRFGILFIWLSIAVVGIAVHGYHIACFPVHCEPDSSGYIQWALSMKKGIIPYANSYRTPLYSFVIAIVSVIPGDMLSITVAVQHCIVLLSCYFIFKIVQLCDMDKRTAVIASLLLVVNSLVLQSAQMIMTETLFMFMTLVSVTTLLKMIYKPSVNNAAITGLLFGSTAYLREMLQPFFGLITVTLLLVKNKRLQHAALIAFAVMTITILPWCIFNKIHFGVFSLSSHAGVNLFTKCVSYHIYKEDSGVFAPVKQSFGNVERDLGVNENDGIHPEDNWSLNRVPHALVDTLITGHGYTFESAGRMLQKIAIISFVTNPWSYTVSIAKTIRELLFSNHELYPSLSTVIPVNEHELPYVIRSLLRGFVYIPGWFIVVFMICGLRKRKLLYWIPGMVFICGILVTSMVQTGLTRYTIPWIPFLLITVSECCVRIYDMLYSVVFSIYEQYVSSLHRTNRAMRRE